MRRTPDLTRSDYVLIVDGNAAFDGLLKTELAGVGLKPIRAFDFATAQQLLREASPETIILDLRSRA